MQQNQVAQNKPLVALLDGRNCSIEMPILKSFAVFAFCDAQKANEIHHKVLNEASAALLWNTMTLTRDDLLKFKALKLIVRIGSSIDNIDVEAAGELGIAVSHVPGCCVDEMADSTLAMILNLYRGTTQLHLNVREGITPATPEQTAEACSKLRRIRGQTLGLIGFGRIGSAVAIRALSFGFNVIFYDPFIKDGIERSMGVQRAETLPDLLRCSDCISLHCPFTVHTHRIINDSTLHHVKPGTFLVNTASGFLIDQLALTNALKEGILAGAAIDVYESSCQAMPLAALKAVPNLLCTPRTAWYSEQSARESREVAANEVKRALLGRIPDSLMHCINKEILIGARLLRERASPPVMSLQCVNQQQQLNIANYNTGPTTVTGRGSYGGQGSGSSSSTNQQVKYSSPIGVSSTVPQQQFNQLSAGHNSLHNHLGQLATAPGNFHSHHSTHLASSIAAVAANQTPSSTSNSCATGGSAAPQPSSSSSRKRHSPQRQPSHHLFGSSIAPNTFPPIQPSSSLLPPHDGFVTSQTTCNSGVKSSNNMSSHFPPASVISRVANSTVSGNMFDGNNLFQMMTTTTNESTTGAQLMNNPIGVGSSVFPNISSSLASGNGSGMMSSPVPSVFPSVQTNCNDVNTSRSAVQSTSSLRSVGFPQLVNPATAASCQLNIKEEDIESSPPDATAHVTMTESSTGVFRPRSHEGSDKGAV